jgi:LmbE family N-acetylglucosaminyl deacetylase
MDEQESKHVLIIGAHIDDELLSFGGALVHHLLLGDYVTVFILVERERFPFEKLYEVYQPIMEKYPRFNIIWHAGEYGLIDQQLDAGPEVMITGIIERFINEQTQARDYDDVVIYSHTENDVNLDHKVVARAVKIASRPNGNVLPNKPIAVYAGSPSVGSGVTAPFMPNHFIELMPREIDLLHMLVERYGLSKQEEIMMERKLAIYGGHIGKDCAEAFEVVYQTV